MQTQDAIEKLVELKGEKSLQREENYIAWRSKVSHVLRSVFGPRSPQLMQFESVSELRNEHYTISGGVNAQLDAFRSDAVRRGMGAVDGAIFALEASDASNPMDESSVDSELWARVSGFVAREEWDHIPAAVSIFVEDKVRTWAGDPRTDGDEAMTGKGLFTKVLSNAGQLRLGKQQSEWQGWMMLGTGLTQAIGNVDRHHIQRREDAKRYALGVLGVGSLLLTQLRHEHQESIDEVEILGVTPGEGPR